MILPSQRGLFDMPRDLCYLNAAYMTPLTRAQQSAADMAVARNMRPWEVTPEDFFTTVEEVRGLAATLLGTTADHIALVPATSYGIATAARNLRAAPGQQVLLLEGQFPSNVYEWMDWAKRQDAETVFIGTPDDDDWTGPLLAAIEAAGDRVALAALPNVHWSSGAVVDLPRVSAALKKVGAALVLDMTQSLGAMPFDLEAVDPDFIAMGSYKWLLGPYGLGLLYVAERHHDGEPLEQNWIARQDSEDFAGLVHYKQGYQPGARRFDMGERSQFILAPVLETGLRHILDWGVDNIAATLSALNMRLAERLAAMGLRPVDAAYRSPHLLGVHMDGRGGQVLQALKQGGVSASLRGDMLRLSPHLWVDRDDEDRFAAALQDVCVPAGGF